MRWWHWIGCYMVIAPFILLGVLPEGFMNGWIVFLLLLGIPCGIGLIKLGKHKPEPHWPIYEEYMKEQSEKDLIK